MALHNHVSAARAVKSCLLASAAVLLLLAAGCSDDNNNVVTGGGAEKSCGDCHVAVAAQEGGSHHQATLQDVAGELSEERVGQTPEEVLHGDDAEDCIACHAPTAVLAGGGMTEVEAMAYFFSTTSGKFTDQTSATHADDWPHVACEACHDAPDTHPGSAPQLASFDSRTASYTPQSDVSSLCGQCHGSLRFTDTDHLTYDAWTASKHGGTQQDVADELAEERTGQSPHEVVTGDDPESCIACHAPTAVLAGGGMTEEEALDYFFSTAGGVFTDGTAIQHADQWPEVACNACHDPHNPDAPSYFNSATREYEPMPSPDQLCGQCHGSLRFASTDHLTYDVRQGSGGIGVADQQLMGGVSCVDCHMYVSDVDGSLSSMQHGHSFSITVEEKDGTATSCDHCHPGMNVSATISGFQSDYAELDATASANVEAAAAALAGSDDTVLLDKLDEAQHNLALAEGDESGGFHNHNYLMALLNDANDRAQEILESR